MYSSIVVTVGPTFARSSFFSVLRSTCRAENDIRSDYAFTMPMGRERSRRRCYGVVELYKSLKIERSFSIKVNEIKTDDDDDDSGASAFFVLCLL